MAIEANIPVQAVSPAALKAKLLSQRAVFEWTKPQ
jgi:hypothetical protein